MRKVSIVIPTWQRFTMTINSFAQVLNDDRVEEVAITDDASRDYSYENLRTHFRNNPKVKLFQNERNLDCYFNKHQAMENATGEWCVLFDSDNILTTKYLDAIYAIPEWDEKTFYLPSFPRPYFDARKWSGMAITKKNVVDYIDTHLMTNLNAMNFFINREEYLKVWDGSVNPITSDSIYFSYCWLKAGNKILVTPDLEYEHFIDKGGNGHYQQNSHKTVEFHKDLMQKIKQML